MLPREREDMDSLADTGLAGRHVSLVDATLFRARPPAFLAILGISFRVQWFNLRSVWSDAGPRRRSAEDGQDRRRHRCQASVRVESRRTLHEDLQTMERVPLNVVTTVVCPVIDRHHRWTRADPRVGSGKGCRVPTTRARHTPHPTHRHLSTPSRPVWQ